MAKEKAITIDGTGNVSFPVTTSWSTGQQMFNQGIGQLHGFWYYEAERTFRQIAAEDPNCAMAYWGMSMANWENTKRSKGFITKAVELKDKVSERERLYISAQESFLADEPKDVKKRRQKLIEDIENIIHEYPDDLEAKAILVVRLWQFSHRGIPIGSRESVDAMMQQIFKENPLHPAHHFRIHLWDGKKPVRALSSAAVLHQTAPSIAHMWHMSGHIYSKLKRYAESAYHQEASARIDHNKQSEFRVLPDTIHNYAHNNEWLIRNWHYVGKVNDSILMSKGLIDNPQHPKLNHYGKGYSSSAFGRKRLVETLEQFEQWDKILELSKTHYLEATENEKLQAERLLVIGRTHFEKQDPNSLNNILDQINERVSKYEEIKKKKTEEAKKKALRAKEEAEKKIAEAKTENIKAKIEEAMFSNDYDKLFSKVRVIVYEGRVLLVGTVEEESMKENANQISWDTKNVKEVANYITIGKNDLIDYVKDTRISLELRAKMLTDKEVSEVNFSVTTENRILYLVGIAQNNKELNKVIGHASNIAGVKKIVNLIKLKDLKDE